MHGALVVHRQLDKWCRVHGVMYRCEDALTIKTSTTCRAGGRDIFEPG